MSLAEEFTTPRWALVGAIVGSGAFVSPLFLGYFDPSLGSAIRWFWYLSFPAVGVVAGVSTGYQAIGRSGPDRLEIIGGGVLPWAILFPFLFFVLSLLLYRLSVTILPSSPSGLAAFFVVMYLVLLSVLTALGFFVGLGSMLLYEWTSVSPDNGQPID